MKKQESFHYELYTIYVGKGEDRHKYLEWYNSLINSYPNNMEISLVAAKILGLYLVVSGLFMIFRGKTLPHMLRDFFEHPAIMYLAGVILIFLSSLFLLQGNIWDGTWRTVITIIAWATLIKGIAYILAPDMLRQMVTKKLMDTVNLYGVVAIIAGVYLFYIG